MRDGEQSTARVFASSVFIKLVIVALGFVNSIVINRCLGVALRGEYTTLLNYSNLAQLLLCFGLGNAYPTFRRRIGRDALGIFQTLLAIQIVIYILIAAFLCYCGIKHDVGMISVLSLVQVLENQTLFFAVVEDIEKRNRSYLISSVIFTLSLIAIYFVDIANLSVILWATVLSHLLNSAAFLYSSGIQKPSTHPDLHILSSIAKVALPTMAMNLLMFCNYNLNVFFLNWISSDFYQIGLYGTALTLGNMLWKLPDAFKDVLYSRAAVKDNPYEIAACIIINCGFALLIVLGFLIFGASFLMYAYGPDFIEAYPMVLLIFIGTFPMIFYKLIHPLYVANGNTRIVVSLLAVSVAVNALLDLMLIPEYSAIGACLATVVAYSICGIAFLLLFVRHYEISFSKLIGLSIDKVKGLLK